MKNITYGILEERYGLCDKTQISYGIAAYCNSDRDGSKTIVASVHNITSDKVALTKLINDCNRLKLSAVHLKDVVEDFLSD